MNLTYLLAIITLFLGISVISLQLSQWEQDERIENLENIKEILLVNTEIDAWNKFIEESIRPEYSEKIEELGK